jgi:transaldolase
LHGAAPHHAQPIEAARIGSDVITAPFNVLTALLKHPLTDSGLAKFLADWEKTKK